MDIQKQIDAMAQEFSAQRGVLGDRAVQLAAVNAQLRAEIEELKKKLKQYEEDAAEAAEVDGVDITR
jgi:regulator of replication initiation timing